MRLAWLLFGIMFASAQSALGWEVVGDTRSAAMRTSSSHIRFASEEIPNNGAWLSISCQRNSHGNVALSSRIDIRIPSSSHLRRRHITRISNAMVASDSIDHPNNDMRLSIDAQARLIQGSRYGLFTISDDMSDELAFEQMLSKLISSFEKTTEIILNSRNLRKSNSIRIAFVTPRSKDRFEQFLTLCNQTT